jgi:hypothetical protein
MADETVASTIPSLAGDVPIPHRGASIGRFVVLGVLGTGGMGAVLSAYDPQRDRYHARSLKTPTEVRRVLIYVLRSGLKHGSTVDPLSSAAWFGGFAGRPPARTDAPPTVSAGTWLLRTGWRRGGAIRPGEMPARQP